MASIIGTAQKLWRHLWAVRFEFSKYTIVGSSGFIFDIGTLILFKEYVGLTPVLAVVLNQIILLAYNFSLNKWWSFRNRSMPHWQLVRYLTLAAFNYAFAVGAMYLFQSKLGYDYRLVRTASVMAMVLWNFALYKHWVYRG